MHPEAYEWVKYHAPEGIVSVLDIGGRNINGSVRDLFPQAAPYVALDLYDGPGVDIVADAATWEPDHLYDVIVCTEVFEHTPDWPAICRTAYAACMYGGRFIMTMAGPGRPEHSAIDGGPKRPDEHYRNIDDAELRDVLQAIGWRFVYTSTLRSPADTRAVAYKLED